MPWQRLTTWAIPLVGLAALSTWQYREYCHECDAAKETLRRQTDSLATALVGGIRHLCRQRCFTDDQVQGLLDELVKSEDVLTAAVISSNGQLRISAGLPDVSADLPSTEAEESWESRGYRFIKPFDLTNQVGRRSATCLCGRPELHRDAEAKSVFLAGGRFNNLFLIDRSHFDDQCRRAAWQGLSVVMIGGLVLLCLAWGWRTTIRLAESHVALDAKSRHLRELSLAAAGLAHETRNPLSLIQGWNQRVARSDLGSPEQQRQAQAVVEECNRLTYRINQFLTLARPIDPKIMPVDSGAIVEELEVLMEPDFQSKKLALDHTRLASGGRIQADREMLRQILFNLLRNAVQWSPEGAVIEIALERGQNGYQRIEISDRGPGIPEEIASSLFMPYFSTRAEGTGLGLAMVHRMATAHGWRVGYSPRFGGGAVFWLDGITHG